MSSKGARICWPRVANPKFIERSGRMRPMRRFGLMAATCRIWPLKDIETDWLLLVDLVPAAGRNQCPDRGPDSSEHTCNNSRTLRASGVKRTVAGTILMACGTGDGAYRGTCAQPNQRVPAAMRFLLHRNPHDVLPPE